MQEPYTHVGVPSCTTCMIVDLIQKAETHDYGMLNRRQFVVMSELEISLKESNAT